MGTENDNIPQLYITDSKGNVYELNKIVDKKTIVDESLIALRTVLSYMEKRSFDGNELFHKKLYETLEKQYRATSKEAKNRLWERAEGMVETAFIFDKIDRYEKDFLMKKIRTIGND